MTERARFLDIQPFLQTASVEEMTARSDHSTGHVLEQIKFHISLPFKAPDELSHASSLDKHKNSSYLEADSTDVVILLQLCIASCGEAFYLVYSISPEQEALPAQLGSEPDVII